MEALDTIARLLRHRHGLAAYCPQCRRWEDLKLGPLIVRGHGDKPLVNLKLRCRDCRAFGELQVRPPVPHFEGATWLSARPSAGAGARHPGLPVGPGLGG
jgi:hypothetical protein